MEKQIAENAKHKEQLTQALKSLRERFAFLHNEVIGGIRVIMCYLDDQTNENNVNDLAEKVLQLQSFSNWLELVWATISLT